MKPNRLFIFPMLSLLLSGAPVLPLVAAESPSIYGIHDHDPYPGEYIDRIKNAVGSGWVTATVAIGANPNDFGGNDFSNISNQGHTVICRLNYGYFPDGTIPVTSQYDNFAQRCANFVNASAGCDIWLIGNECNLAAEWPFDGTKLAYVSPQDYATLFRKVYNKIKAIRPNAKVLPQALAPWAGPYGAGNLNGYNHDAMPLNWVQYLNQMLTAISQSGPVDGISLHINSRGYSYADIHSTAQVNAGGQNLYWSFKVYQDWIDYGIPPHLYHLPLYATECNGNYYWKGGHPDDPSKTYQAGWMQEIYAEINRHNQACVTNGRPIFKCVNMYRWCAWCDGWNIDGPTNPYKGQILSDLDGALAANYKWPTNLSSPGEIIVDNTAATLTGSWTLGTSGADKFAWNYRFKGNGGGTSWAQFTPNIPGAGNYFVYHWYSAGANRTTNANHVINYNGGSQTIGRNQQINGGGWNYLGTFSFNAGTSGYVRVTDGHTDAGTVVMADAIRFVPAPVADVIVDNPAATVVGTWSTGTTAADKYGSNYRYKGPGTGSAYLQFTPTVAKTGNYVVSEWHSQGSNRTTNAPHVITYNGGTQTVGVNQQINGGTWHSIGTFNFAAGTAGNIRITDGFSEAGRVVMADAVKLAYVPPLPPPFMPMGLSASMVSASQINLNWQDKSANEANFVIARGTLANGPYSDIATVGANVTSYANTSLNPATTYYYVVRSRNSGGDSPYSNEASATTSGSVPDIIIDNPSATIVGTWSTGTSATDKFAADYRFKTQGTGVAYAEFRPNIVTAGNYRIYEWHPQGSNRTVGAPHIITHNSGSNTYAINQQINGGTWNLVATHFFAAGTGGYVRITDGFPDAGKAAMADAIKFVYVP